MKAGTAEIDRSNDVCLKLEVTEYFIHKPPEADWLTSRYVEARKTRKPPCWPSLQFLAAFSPTTQELLEKSRRCARIRSAGGNNVTSSRLSYSKSRQPVGC
jgi:hypothetical protein